MPRYLIALVSLLAFSWSFGVAAELSRQSVNSAEVDEGGVERDERSAVVLKTQVLLDRSRFSPGVIDGYWGENTAKAVSLLRRENEISGLDEIDGAVWNALGADEAEDVLVEYTISEEDVAGPFIEVIPDDFRRMAEMERLAYTGPLELLAERFHMDEDLMQALNEGADFGTPGTTITVAEVAMDPPAESVRRIEVDKQRGQLRAYSAGGDLLVAYPATIGSSDNPSPTGSHQVASVAMDPTYRYDPEVIEGDADEVLILPPGPNGPVGSVWIDLGEDGYGIHGTAEPSLIDKTYSHGCVRLTNWDAEELAELVEPGATTVEFLD